MITIYYQVLQRTDRGWVCRGIPKTVVCKNVQVFLDSWALGQTRWQTGRLKCYREAGLL